MSVSCNEKNKQKMCLSALISVYVEYIQEQGH